MSASPTSTATTDPPEQATVAPPPVVDESLAPNVTGGPRFRGRWLVFAAVLIADVMDLVDSTITNVGGPTIRADLGGGQPMLQWLGAGYTLAFAVFLITGSRLGDLYGRRKLFLIGAAGFTTMSALCALAWSPESLITLRVLQGSLGALMIPQGFGMLTEILQEDEMAKAFGVFGPIMGLSAVIGPIIGALLIDADLFNTGWRLIFLINVPLGLIALMFGWRNMPRNVVAPGGGVDPGGMVLIGAASLALIYPLIEGREKGWPAWTFVLMVVGVLLIVAFAFYERRRPTDSVLVQFSLLKNKSFTSAMAVAIGFFAAVSGVMLVLALFWQVGEHRTPIKAAIALAPLSVGMIIGMVASFALIEKLGRKLVQLGTVLTAIGLVVLAASVSGSTDPSAWSLFPAVALIGAGMGQVFGQLFDVALASLDESEVGSATGVLNALQQLSFSFGVAAVGTLFFNLLDVPHLPSDALAITALVAIVPLVASFFLAFKLPEKPRAEGAGAH